MVFNYLEESGLGNKLVEIIAEALEPIIEEIRKGEIKMFKDNNTVITGPICCEPVREAGIGDKCHKIYALVQENVMLAYRIHDFMFTSKNSNDCIKANTEPCCMDEELTAIMDEQQRLHLILLGIMEHL